MNSPQYSDLLEHIREQLNGNKLKDELQQTINIYLQQNLELLRTADAWPCLAHPVQYHLDGPQLEALIRHLKQRGLRGLEVYHPSQTPGQSCQLREMARSHGLLPSGGSDFHGSNKPDIRLGVGRGGLRVSQALLEDIRKDHAAKSR